MNIISNDIKKVALEGKIKGCSRGMTQEGDGGCGGKGGQR